ncbi:MAG: NAD(P)-binding domain-containing protein [Planctomycetota bacterium]
MKVWVVSAKTSEAEVDTEGVEGETIVNLTLVAAAAALLVVVLILLGSWQRRILELQRSQIDADLAEARRTGSELPIAQHPQVNLAACIGCGSCVAACPEEGVLALVDGVAKVVHGSRCVGHGRCADACPVAAIQVGLGDVAERIGVPHVSEKLESSVGGVYIAGELGGFSLIRNATRQGVQAVTTIASELRGQSRGTDALDLLIVGAGPAGIAASLRAAELGLRHAVIDRDDIGGTVRKYPRRKLTLTGRLELPLFGVVNRDEFLKEELIAFWEQLIARYQLPVRARVELTGLRPHSGGFTATTSVGEVHARRVLLAIGRRGTPRKLDVPGEESERVLYQLVEAASFQQEQVLVVGGGDSAVEAAVALAEQGSNTVTLSYRKPAFFRLKSRNQSRIEELTASGKIQVLFSSTVQRIEPGVVFLHQEIDGASSELPPLQSDYVFALIGGETPHPLLRSIGIEIAGQQRLQAVGAVPS